MNYYDILIAGVDKRLRVRRIIHGVSWVAAELDGGRFGIALHERLESRPRMYPTLVGLCAREAAEAVRSWNLLEASEGMAVINAFYNTMEHIESYGAACDFETRCTDGMDTVGKKVAVIGHMALQAQSLRDAAEVYIIERAPKDGDYPDAACEYLLPDCDIVIITASAAVNKTMPRLLELSMGAKIVIVGPTAPLCPALGVIGIDRISGMVVRDKEAFVEWMTQHSGSPYPHGETFMLR